MALHTESSHQINTLIVYRLPFYFYAKPFSLQQHSKHSKNFLAKSLSSSQHPLLPSSLLSNVISAWSGLNVVLLSDLVVVTFCWLTNSTPLWQSLWVKSSLCCCEFCIWPNSCAMRAPMAAFRSSGGLTFFFQCGQSLMIGSVVAESKKVCCMVERLVDGWFEFYSETAQHNCWSWPKHTAAAQFAAWLLTLHFMIFKLQRNCSGSYDNDVMLCSNRNLTAAWSQTHLNVMQTA